MSQNDFTPGRWLLRDGRPYQVPNIPGKEYEISKLLHSLQDHGIIFKPMVRVHNSQPDYCEACSA